MIEEFVECVEKETGWDKWPLAVPFLPRLARGGSPRENGLRATF